jgi:hypothetical protein
MKTRMAAVLQLTVDFNNIKVNYSSAVELFSALEKSFQLWKDSPEV